MGGPALAMQGWSKSISTLGVLWQQFQGRCEGWAPGAGYGHACLYSLSLPVKAALKAEGQVYKQGTAGCSWPMLNNVLLLDYNIGNHVALVAATQGQAFRMSADQMQ